MSRNIFGKASIYAFLYILTIAVFAAVYVYYEDEFYYASIGYEKSSYNLNTSIQTRIANGIFDNIENSCDNHEYSDEWSICGSYPSVQIDSFEDGVLKLEIALDAWVRDIKSYRMQRIEFDTSIKVDEVYERDVPGEEGVVIHFDGYRTTGDRTNETNIDEYISVFLAQIVDRSVFENVFTIFYSNSISKLFYDYKESENTAPLNIDGSIVRMIYFSIVTQSTLGYGDIVPLSDRTRILVGLHTILGLIIIGLFLNALATKASGK